MKNYNLYQKQDIITFYYKIINKLTAHFVVVDNSTGKIISKFYGKY